MGKKDRKVLDTEWFQVKLYRVIRKIIKHFLTYLIGQCKPHAKQLQYILLAFGKKDEIAFFQCKYAALNKSILITEPE